MKASEQTRYLLTNCIVDYPVLKQKSSTPISEREYWNILVKCQEEMPPEPEWSSLRDAIHQKIIAKAKDESPKKKARTDGQGPEQGQVTLCRIDIDTTSCIIQVYIQSALYTTRG